MALFERPNTDKMMNQKRIPRPGKTFVNPLNKQLGRRTGRNFRAGRNIRVGKDGLENFDDYLSESDTDSICLSDIHEQSGRTTDGNKENETTNTQSIMIQSVPLPDKGSMVSNSTADSIALTQNSQLSMMKHSRFDWLRNRDIGRRTGKDMRANKQIRVDKNGMENFDDYLSESDAESFLSASSCKRRTSEKMAIQRKTLDSPDQCKSNRVQGEKSPGSGGFHDHVEKGQQITNSPTADSNRINSEKKRMNESEDGNIKSSNSCNGTVISNNDEGTDGVIYLESTSKNVGRNRHVLLTSSKGDKRRSDKEFVPEMESDHNSLTGDRNQTRNKVVDKSHVNRPDHIHRKDNKYEEEKEHEIRTDNIENDLDESVDNDVDDEQVDENSSEIDDGDDFVDDLEDDPDNDEDDELDTDGEDDPNNDEEDESNYEGDDNTRSKGQSKSGECESEHENDSENESFEDEEEEDKVDVLENSKLNQHKSKHNMTNRSNRGDVNPEVNEEESDESEHLAVNDRNREGSSQALSGLDVAGNKSGSITKRVDPGTAVSFNRTKKRLSYSALEASAESKKARAQRVEMANSELANQDCQGVTVKQPHLDEQLPSSVKPTDMPLKFVKKPEEATKNAVTMDEDNFLCLSTRSLHTAHLLHTKQSEDEDTDISIVDDTRTHFFKKKSLTATKTRKSLKNTVEENVSKSVGKLKGGGSYLKRKKSKLPRKSVTKQKVKKVKAAVEKQGRRRSSSNKSKSQKRNQNIRKNVLDEKDHCDDNESNDIENHFSMSEQESNNKQSHTDTRQKYQSRKKGNSLEKNTSKVSKTVGNKLTDTSLNRKSHAVRKNSVSVEGSTTEKKKIQGSHKKSSKKRKSSSEESTDKESDGRETVVSKKKKAKPSARKFNLQGSTNDNLSQQCGSPTKVPVQTPDPDSRLVSAGLKSGKSLRVSRRSEILETITSGPLSRGTEVELEPNNGLTPCITKKGQPRKSKGRRVTIGPEENRHFQLSDDEGTLVQKSVPNRFRHSMSLADVETPLPSPSTTPVHIFECTKSDSPTSVSKLPTGYDELPVEDRCIRPEPAPDGLRRSQRVRLKPVAWYKNERIICDFKPDIGPVIVGVKPSMEIVYKKKEEIQRRKRQLRNALIKATKGKNKKSHRKLSIHAKLPDDFCPVEQDDISVINPDTQEEDGIGCIAYRDSVMAVGPTGESPKSADPFSVTKLFDQPCMSAGTLNIMPLAAKPESRVSEQALLLRILEGKLLVKIHNTTALLETDDTFFVPYGNTYSLTNLRNDRARVFYTVHKFFDNDQSSIVK